MRKRYRFINGQCVEVFNEEEARAKALHSFSSDEMPPTLHPANGKFYTSKAKFRAETKAHGFEEVGNAYQNGYDPAKEREKALNKRFKELRSQRVEMMRELLD